MGPYKIGQRVRVIEVDVNPREGKPSECCYGEVVTIGKMRDTRLAEDPTLCYLAEWDWWVFSKELEPVEEFAQHQDGIQYRLINNYGGTVVRLPRFTPQALVDYVRPGGGLRVVSSYDRLSVIRARGPAPANEELTLLRLE